MTAASTLSSHNAYLNHDKGDWKGSGIDLDQVRPWNLHRFTMPLRSSRILTLSSSFSLCRSHRWTGDHMKSDRNLMVPEPSEADIYALTIEAGLEEAQVRGWFDRLDQRVSDLIHGAVKPKTQLDCELLNRRMVSLLGWSSGIPLVPQGVRIHRVMLPFFYATSNFEDDSSTESRNASAASSTTTSSSSSNDVTESSVSASSNDDSSDDTSSLDSIEAWNQNVAALLAEAKKKELVFNTVATPEKSSLSLDKPESFLAEDVSAGAHSLSLLLEEMVEQQGDIAFSADSQPMLSPLPVDGSDAETGKD